MSTVGLTLAAFISGSLPFSYWLAQLAGRDLRQVGDGNPGTVNAFKAAGPVVGTAALLLDFLKGMAPVGAAVWLLGIRGWPLLPVGIAPVLGHAFSPFLGLRGGKAIAVTFGVWSGITLWEAPCLLGVAFLFGRFVLRMRNDAWVVMLGMLVLLAYVALRLREPQLVALSLLNTALLAWTHRRVLLDR
jgi:glycerol-3-phosphate acyltransferase PlsY